MATREMELYRVEDGDRATLPEQAAENALARQMVDILLRQFPGYGWQCGASIAKGLVWVGIPAVMGPTLREVEHYDKLLDEADLKKWLRKSGGKILEAFGLRRTGFEIGNFESARERRILATDKKIPTFLT